MSDTALIAHMSALVNEVSPHEAAFVAEGLPSDLLARITDEVRELRNAKNALTMARLDFTTTFVSMRQTQQRADKTIAATEAIAITLRDKHPGVLQALRTAKRIGRRRTKATRALAAAQSAAAGLVARPAARLLRALRLGFLEHHARKQKAIGPPADRKALPPMKT
jgi:hypothetical protein